MQTEINYFELFHIPLSFKIDKQKIEQTYYALSRKYHPDHNASEDSLWMSSTINKARKVLSSKDELVAYVLQMKNKLDEAEDKHKYPSPSFLMAMMEINEELMDALDNVEQKKVLKQRILEKDEELEKGMHSVLNTYQEGMKGEGNALEQIKQYYYQRKYIKRLRKSIEI